jgi:hypothetical protein
MTAYCFVHAALSAAVVGVVLSLLRSSGPRAMGLTAAIPINSVPALFWLSMEHGSTYTASAVLGSLWGTGLTVLLGAGFARMASALHPARAALLAGLAVGALALLTSSLPSVPAAAAAATLCAILLGRAALPRLRASDLPRRADGRSGCLLSMAAAGAMSLLVSALSRHSGPQLCGLVAAIPVVGMFALHAGSTRRCRSCWALRGYSTAWWRRRHSSALGCAWVAVPTSGDG